MTLRLDAEARARKSALEAELRALKKPEREAARKQRKAQREARPKTQKLPPKPRRPRTDDGSAYMAWLHEGLPCIACLVFGKHALSPLTVEAAHQKVQRADRGYNRAAGRRGPHWTCVPLCAGHHRIGPLCCDPAQGKFWSGLGLEADELIDFIEALNAAFREGRPGAPVVHRFARLAADNRVRRAA